MTHREMNKFLAGGIFAAVFWAAVAAAAPAQSGPVFGGAITTRSADVSANFGWSNLEGVDNSKHINFGGAGGYNVTPHLTVLGEYQFLPMGKLTETGSGTSVTAKASYDMFGGAARFNFSGSRRFVPYGVLAAGAARSKATAAAQGISATATINGYYIGFGGGASWFLGRNWGVRPEARWIRQEFSSGGTNSGQNAVLVGAGVFFQLGGRSKSARL
jgi:hypothetical protein